MYEDKTIVCADCGQEFTFTASEQAFYAEKGFTDAPKRCKPCRQARKAQRNSGSYGDDSYGGGGSSCCGGQESAAIDQHENLHFARTLQALVSQR